MSCKVKGVYPTRHGERMLIDCKKGTVIADLVPEKCEIKWIEAAPTGKLLGTIALPLVEQYLASKGCKKVWASPKDERSERFWSRQEYEWDKMPPQGWRFMSKTVHKRPTRLILRKPKSQS